MMKHIGVAAFAAVLMAAGSAQAAKQPAYQWNPNSPILPQTILVAPNANGALGVIGGDANHPVYVTGGTGSGSSTAAVTTSFAPGACSATTVGTTATKIIDTAASGVPRNGGGFQNYPASTISIVYSWTAGATLTATTPGAFVLSPGGTIPFAGAPNTALYAIVATGTASVSGGCMTE